MHYTPFTHPEVMAVFDGYTNPVHNKLMALRELILATAKTIDEVGDLEETLKWGQPSYLTPTTKSGSTIRIDKIKAQANQYAMYFNCQTTLVETFRELYPELMYEGNRAIVLSTENDIPTNELQDCIGMALTYHLRKKNRR